MDTAQRIQFLQSSTLFAQTPLDVVAESAGRLAQEDLEGSRVVFHKDDPGLRMYLIVKGTVSVHDAERVIRTLGAGDAFGEMALLDHHPRAATVTTLEPTTLLSLDRDAFDALVISRPEVSRAIQLVLSSHVRSNTDSMALDFALRLELERRVQQQLRELADAQLAMIFALSKLAETRDSGTGLHLERVREYCRILAAELERSGRSSATFGPELVELVYQASPLHDIGKVAIPDGILGKAGALTPEEFRVMKTHTELGAQTLRRVAERYPGSRLVAIGIEIAESHHERWDGSGYPRGLVGEAIPLSARIVALADVYDALTSRRPYKEPYTDGRTRQLILDGRGTHFDPVLVDTFVAVEAQFLHVRQTMGDAAPDPDLTF